MTKGEKLNKRVWVLFEKAGFITKPNSIDPAEFIINIGRGRPVDLYAEIPELGVKIIGSNKSGGIKGSWTAHMNDCEDLRKRAGAQKCLLVATDHELDSGDVVHANSLNMPIWTEENLSYYEEVVESIGKYAKYEIVHSLGIHTNEESDIHKVLAIKLNQPTTNSDGVELFAFSMSPERLLRISVIYRKAQGNANAYQRMLKRSRLPKIAKFLDTPDAILPTDLILHLDDSVKVNPINIKNICDTSGTPIPFSNTSNYTPVALDIPMKYASMEIVDGQHRLYGFVHASSEIRDKFNLVVIGMRKLTDKQKRETFIAINDNSRRMDANLVTYLKYTPDDTLCQNDSSLMSIRVVVELNKQHPFKKSIKLLDMGKERLTLKGLSGYDLKGLLGSNGYLRKYNATNNPDEYVRMLRIYFSILYSEFTNEWKDPNKYIIATNRGITALLKLLKSILKYENSWPIDERFKQYAKALKKHWKTWEITKLKNSYIGGKGWKDFHRDLIKAIKKDKIFKDIDK